MAYDALNNLIDAYIYRNGIQAITGQILNGVLKQMVAQLGGGYNLMGVAIPATTPATNDEPLAYFAATAGEYTDFGGITLAAGEIAVLQTSGDGTWAKQTIYNVPTGTADLENTANFITNAVTDLVNYYTKTEIDALPNGEDIDFDEDGKLQFANRVYNAQQPNGMGYKILRKDATFASQVTDTNTIYEIRYQFDLGNESVTIPTGCELRFNGGKLANGTIVGQMTKIVAEDVIFSGIALDGNFANREICISWFVGEEGDISDIMENLMVLSTPAVFLDRVTLKISHPIHIPSTITATEQRNLLKLVYGLEGTARFGGITRIIPSNNYSADGYERNAFFFIESHCGTQFNHFRFEGNYKVGYGVYIKGYFTRGINDVFFQGLAISAIKIGGTESAIIQRCNAENCGTFLIAHPYGVDEENVLNFSTPSEGQVLNILYLIDNYSVYTNYGIVIQPGSEVRIVRNAISYTSCYAIYALNAERNLDIIDCYFEGCGGGNRWIDYTGLQVKDSSLCDHLANSHKGEGNQTISVGWGLAVNQSERMRPIIHIQGSVSRPTMVNFKGNNFSTNYSRSKQTDVFLSTDQSALGIDAIASLMFAVATMDGQYVGPGSGDYSGMPRFFLCLGATNTSISTNAIQRDVKVTLSELPKTINIKDWILFNHPGTIEDRIKVVLLDKSEMNENSVPVAAKYNDTVTKEVQEIAPFVSVVNGVPFRRIPKDIDRDDYSMSYVFPIQYANLDANTEDKYYDVYFHNPTSGDITLTTAGYYRLTSNVITELNSNYLITRYGAIVIGAGQTIKFTFCVSPHIFMKASNYIRSIYMSFFASADGLLVSDPYGHTVNNTPRIPILYPQDYDEYGRKRTGATASRPTLLATDTGFIYTDTDLGKSILWNGTAWVNMDGTSLA